MRTIDEIIADNRLRPVIIAHRGASFYQRENTMKAFRAAVEMRPDMIELDVRRTADNVLVVHHDPDYAGNRIGSMSGSRLKGESGSAGYSVPTLVEVLEFCTGKIPVDIELKEAGYEEQILETVLNVMEPDRFLITSSFDVVIRRVKDLNPAIRTGLIIGSRPRWQLVAKLFPGGRARRSGADILVVSGRLVRAGFLSTTRNLELPVWVYTVNDRKDLWKCITDIRIAGVFSDRPDVALFLRDLHAVSQGIEKTSGVGVSE